MYNYVDAVCIYSVYLYRDFLFVLNSIINQLYNLYSLQIIIGFQAGFVDLIYREEHGYTLEYNNHNDFSMRLPDQYKKSISCLCSNINLLMLFLLLNKNKPFPNILCTEQGGEIC